VSALEPTTADLARAAGEALAFLGGAADVVESEVFVAANGQLLARLGYASHLPSNGVEEPKSTASHGLGLHVVFRGDGGPRLGFGSEPSDLSLEGVRRALAKARASAVHDPAFVSLPRPGPERRVLREYHDPRLLAVGDEGLVAAGWTVVEGALRAFQGSARLGELAGAGADPRGLGLLLGGDVTIVQERAAIASTAMPAVQTDESTIVAVAATAMVEAMDAKGSGWSLGTRLEDLGDGAGVEAARAALAAAGGERVRSGRYPVVLGAQPVADLLSNLLLPALHASAFYASNTPFLGRLGRRVAAPTLSIYDDGARPGLAGSKGITCEGLPTGRTALVTDGVLTALLTNWYEAQRLRRDPHARAKLGVDPAEAASALVPRNGFRFVPGGGRSFAAAPGIAATNVFVACRDTAPLPELLRRMGDGLYVGRIWYTYPINGLEAGDFTCTVVGDSYVVRDGRLAAPLRANTLRIDGNLASVLDGIVGATPEVKATGVWAADEVVHAPALAVAGLEVTEIAGFVDRL
jgi:predicted Zn-dependent protease